MVRQIGVGKVTELSSADYKNASTVFQPAERLWRSASRFVVRGSETFSEVPLSNLGVCAVRSKCAMKIVVKNALRNSQSEGQQ
jgi:hypothetical protein